MTDYSAVAPPSNLSGGFDPSSAFADALQRARQVGQKIAAKIVPNNEGNNVGGTKRPLEEAPAEQNVTKKMAAINDPIGAQLAAMQQQHRMGGMQTEEFHVPDKMVGLIIGRGGEQITRLQAESGCKIQMAADSGGLPDRSCTLTGSRMSIDKAKEMIMDIVNRGSASTLDVGSMQDGQFTVEMSIPAPKVGLIIGKGGETIKSLQERAGVKMVMIQDGMFSNAPEKPLRIKGDPQKAEYARQLVLDLLTERELEVQTNMTRGGFNRNPHQSQTNEYGSAQSGSRDVTMPRQAVGVVIGKGGEMIKKIQQQSGARVQFQRGGQDDGPDDRICTLTGTPEQLDQAESIIHDLINSVMQRDQQNMGRGRGRGRDGFDERRDNGGVPPRDFPPHEIGRGGPPPLPNRGGPPPEWTEITYTVPANKCGIVIGKGGETIRGINQQSGAHVELSRNPPPNPAEKMFVIRGLPSQIEHAKQLINDKIGGVPGGGPPVGYGMPPGPPTGPPAPQYPPAGQHPQQPPPGGPQPFAPQGWGNAYQPWQAPGQPAATDPAKQAADAWAAYYAQYYNQTQQAAQPAPGQAPAAPTAPPAAQQPAQTGAATSSAPSAASTSSGAAQPDYSAAWAEYYRSLGMFREAEMIEQQARQSQQTVQQPGATQQPQNPQPPATATQPQQAVQPPVSQVQPPGQLPQPPYGQYAGQYGPQYGQPQQQQPPHPATPYPPYNYGAYPPQQ